MSKLPHHYYLLENFEIKEENGKQFIIVTLASNGLVVMLEMPEGMEIAITKGKFVQSVHIGRRRK